MKKNGDTDFLNVVFEQILNISKGGCDLTMDYIFSHKDQNYQRVLEGLLFLHQDLELYKVELREAWILLQVKRANPEV